MSNESTSRRPLAGLLLIGNDPIELKTKIELQLFAALKAVLLEHGDKGSLKDVRAEFYLDRYAFIDAAIHCTGDVQICQDGNNGRDLVRLK